VVLLDLKLPRVRGLEVLTRIGAEQRARPVPIVILTSSSEDRDLKDRYDRGADSYDLKPIRSEVSPPRSRCGRLLVDAERTAPRLHSV
jgi:CheY-like chemotaxis protein